MTTEKGIFGSELTGDNLLSLLVDITTASQQRAALIASAEATEVQAQTYLFNADGDVRYPDVSEIPGEEADVLGSMLMNAQLAKARAKVLKRRTRQQLRAIDEYYGTRLRVQSIADGIAPIAVRSAAIYSNSDFDRPIQSTKHYIKDATGTLDIGFLYIGKRDQYIEHLTEGIIELKAPEALREKLRGRTYQVAAVNPTTLEPQVSIEILDQ